MNKQKIFEILWQFFQTQKRKSNQDYIQFFKYTAKFIFASCKSLKDLNLSVLIHKNFQKNSYEISREIAADDLEDEASSKDKIISLHYFSFINCRLNK